MIIKTKGKRLLTGELRHFIIQGENKVDVIYLALPAFYKGLDLTKFTWVMETCGENGAVQQALCAEKTEQELLIRWSVEKPLTNLYGNICIRLVGINPEGEEVIVFVGDDIYIAPYLADGKAPSEEYAVELLKQMVHIFDQKINELTGKVDTATQAALDTAINLEHRAETGEFNGDPGPQGEPGKDGYSPIVTVTQTGQGHLVEIIDAEGKKSFAVEDGKQGEAGPTGPEGPAGKEGPKGNPGEAGPPGEQGPQGEKGDQGEQGIPGEDGFSPTVAVEKADGGHTVTVTTRDGKTEFTVKDGERGEAGPKGEPGAEGPAGPQGETGVPGPAGIDGVSPVVLVSEIENGHRVKITGKEGEQTFDVMDGAKGETGEAGPQGPPGEEGAPGLPGEAGEDGYSPTVTVEETEVGHTVTITDKTGGKTFEVLNGTDGKDGQKGESGPKGDPGEPGANGEDGFSPAVLVSETTGGHIVSITDREGKKEFTVLDGAKGDPGETGPAGPQGQPGEDGIPGSDGKDGVSPAVSVETVEGGYKVTITDKEGGKEFTVLNGAPGQDGAPGEAGENGADGMDGFSPIVTVSSIEGGHQIEITDKTGPKSFIVFDGAKGDPGEDGAPGTPGQDGSPGSTGPQGEAGEDGFSPTVSISEISGGHKVEITDKDGAKSFEVMDGQDGEPGAKGEQGEPGAQGPAGPNQLSSQTTTSGFTNGQYLYNNNGKVGAKAITPASIGALYLNDSGQLSSPAKAYPIDFGYDAIRNIAIMPSSQEDQIHNFAHGTIVILLEE